MKCKLSHFEYDVVLTFGKYSNGNTAIRLISNDEWQEPIATATINLGFEIPENEAYIKDYSENEGMEQFLKDNGFIENEPLETVSSNYVMINKYKLTPRCMDMIKKERSK